MPRIKKTFSMNETTLKILELLCADMDMSSQSEVIRVLLAKEAVSRGIISSTEEAAMLDFNAEHKSDIASEMNKILTQIQKLQMRFNDLEEMTYQIRDGINTNLQCMNLRNDEYRSADPNIDPSTSFFMKQSKENFNISKRNRSINKANFKG